VITLATSVVLTAALLCWIRAFLDLGAAGYPGIFVALAVAGWIFHRRLSDHPPPERHFLIGGLIALPLGIIALLVM
jgi:hypothetical protein